MDIIGLSSTTVDGIAGGQKIILCETCKSAVRIFVKCSGSLTSPK